jgi:hypothetical protein
MTSIDETAPDLWERLDGDTYWLPLAPKNADEYFSGEVDNLFITREFGSWWLSHSGQSGASEFAELSDAKAAGENILQQSNADMESMIISSLSIPVDEWEVAIDNGTITVASKEDPSVQIFGSAGIWNEGMWSIEGAAPSESFTKIFEVAKSQVTSVVTLGR